MTPYPPNIDNERLEIRLLLEAIFLKSGFDFRGYASAHLKRRLEQVKRRAGAETFCQVTERLIYDPDFFDDVLAALSINVTEMFRDPSFYASVRENVIPHLQTYPFIKVWHAGCSAGQEVYSMAILLEEEAMKDRAQIYATDINAPILDIAKRGIYPLDVIKQYTSNYQKSGGKHSFSEYYISGYESVTIKQKIRKNILFSPHNLATDGVFGEMNIIFCRNVLIYFGEELQNRVIKLFLDSLCNGGFLCLGSRETLRFCNYEKAFETIDEKEKIYRKRHTRS